MPSCSSAALFIILVASYHLALGAPVPGSTTAISEVDSVHAGTDGDASGGSAHGVNNTNRPDSLLGDLFNEDGLISKIISGKTGKSGNDISSPLINVDILSGNGGAGASGGASSGSNPSSVRGHKWVFPRRRGSQKRYN